MRNAKGKVMAFLCQKNFKAFFTPKIAKTKAIRVYLFYGKDGLNLQLLESDTLMVVRTHLKMTWFLHYEFAKLPLDTLSFFFFWYIQIGNMFYKTSEAVHGSVKLILGVEDKFIWSEKPPFSIKSIIVKEISYL